MIISKKNLTEKFYQNHEKYTLQLMLLPSILVLCLIIVIPLIYMVHKSFYDFFLYKPFDSSFIGLGNYVRAFLHDDRFYNSLWVSFLMISGCIFLQTIVGLILAESLNALKRFKETFRTVLIIPMVIPPMVSAMVWRMMYHPSSGIINYFLSFIGLDHPWLADPKTALLAIIIIDTWQWTPFLLLIFLAGYATIPNELYESAQVDGAGRWNQFRHITLPLLTPVILIGIIYRIFGVMQTFSTIFITTEGGPVNATETLNYYTYVTAFNFTDIGYASALGVVLLMFAMILATTLFFIINWTTVER